MICQLGNGTGQAIGLEYMIGAPDKIFLLR